MQKLMYKGNDMQELVSYFQIFVSAIYISTWHHSFKL